MKQFYDDCAGTSDIKRKWQLYEKALIQRNTKKKTTVL
jgi:hypothetical protein